MAKKNRIPEVEREREESMETLIPRLLAEMGTQKAVADDLGLSQATISMWLKENGYTPKTIYIKEEKESAT